MAERHKHADLIIAWANGAEIQYLYHPMDGGKPLWESASPPRWAPATTYRIKPKPDYTLVCHLRAYGDQQKRDPVPGRWNYGDVLCTFDGETDKIKEVRVPK